MVFLVKYTVLSRLNAGPRLNAGLEKTPCQNCRFLNKRRGRLIGPPAFDRDPGVYSGRGHKDRLQVNSNLLNGTFTTCQVQYAVLVF